MQTKDYDYLIKIFIWIIARIIRQEYTLNHLSGCKLFVLDKNTWYLITVCIQMITDK